MELTAKLIEVSEIKKLPPNKEGKEFEFIELLFDKNTEYNNLLSLNIFGSDKINNFKEFATIGGIYDLDINVFSKKSKTGDRYFTNVRLLNIKLHEND